MKVCSRFSASLTAAFLALLVAVPWASAQTTATFTPSSLTLSGTSGGPLVSQQVTLNLAGQPNTQFSVAPVQYSGTNYVWLGIAPPSGNSPYTTDSNGNATLTVRADPSQLPPATYSGSIQVYVGAQQIGSGLPVTFNVTGQTSSSLSASPASVSFTYQPGGSTPVAQQVTINSLNAAQPNVAYNAYFTPTNTTQPFVTITSTGGTPFNTGTTGTTSGSFLITPNLSVISQLATGTYTGNVTVTGGGSAVVTIPVSLTVSNAPALIAIPGALTFNFNANSTVSQSQAIVLNGTAGQSYSATVAYPTGQTAQSFVNVSQPSGTTPGPVIVTVNPQGLAAGTYTATVTLTLPAQGSQAAQTIQVPVTVNVSASPLLNYSPNALTFAYQIGQSNAQTQTITLTGTQTGTATPFTASIATTNGVPFLSFNSVNSGSSTVSGQASASAPATLTLAVNPSGLAVGTYSGTITITMTNTGQTMQIPVTLIVSNSALLQVTPSALNFNYQNFSGLPAAQYLNISSTSSQLTFTATATGSFIQLPSNPYTNTTAAGATIQLPVQVNPSNLTDGTYTGYITITSTGAQNSTTVVPVTLTISTNSTLNISTGTSTVNFTYAVGGQAPPTKQVVLSSSGLPISFNYNVTYPTVNSPNFLTVQPSGGAASTSGTSITPSTLTLGINTAALANAQPGTYSAVVNITPTSGSSQATYSIPVILTVTPAATLAVSSPSSGLTYTFTTGGSAPGSQTVQLTASNGAAIPFTATANQPFITVTPSSGTTPASLTISVNPANLTAGPYNGTVTITSPGANNTITIPVSLTVNAVTAGNIAALVNAASQLAGPVSPGEIITIYGTNLGPATAVFPGLTNNNTAFPTTAGNVQVTFDGIPAPLTYVSATQVNAIVPYEIRGRSSTTVAVMYNGIQSSTLSFRVQDTEPGIFTANASGTGQAAAQLANYSANSPTNPVSRGNVITLYATGEGLTTPFTTGAITPVVPVSQLPVLNTQPVMVTLGSPTTAGGTGQVQAQVLYAGEAPGLVAGVLQVNILIPQNAPTGANVPVTIQIGSQTSQNGVTLAIQ